MVLLVHQKKILNVMSSLIFTFHYGSISTWKKKCKAFNLALIYIPLWFYQYFSILKIIKSIYPNLHSTMVLLVHDLEVPQLQYIQIYIPLWFYQYFRLVSGASHSLAIYIPLWFYQYMPTAFTFKPLIYIYIPLWFYQYWNMSKYIGKSQTYLHSTMVLLVPSRILQVPPLVQHLHSTMVLLVLSYTSLHFIFFSYLHSTMVLLVPLIN